MLSKPVAGWTHVTFANQQYSASYVTEVPLDFLEKIVKTLEEKEPHHIVLDSESEGEYTILFDLKKSYLIDYDKILVEERDILEIAEEVYEDIRTNFTDWSKWTPAEEDQEDYGTVLSTFLKDLHILIKEERANREKVNKEVVD